MGRMKDKVCVITGGARGLGLAAAEVLLAEGAKVLITDMDRAAGEAEASRLAAKGAPIAFERQDVTDPQGWGVVLDGVVARWGRLDVLVNNAGVAVMADVETSSFETWKKTLSVNLDGVFLGTQAAIARMKASGGGSIVNIASIEGLIGEPLIPAYNASKGGVRIFTRCESRIPSVISSREKSTTYQLTGWVCEIMRKGPR